MLILLNHAGNLEGISDLNYDIDKDMVENNINNLNNNINTKDSVSLRKCISHTNNKNKENNKNIDLKNNSLPTNEELNEVNYQKEINIELIKEKADLEEFYKNILIKINENYKRREEEMRLHILGMNNHIKYLEQKKKNLENFNYALNTSFMDLKYDIDLNNKNMSEEIESNKNKNNLLTKSLNESKKKAKIEKDMDQKEYDKRQRQVAYTLRNQIKTNRETSALAEKQYNIINKIYQQKINSIKNKYDMVEAKYKLLQEKIFQNSERGQNSENEFENIMRGFRERMKQHEQYIVGIKQMVEGDYDHYEVLKQITQNKNQKFFDDVNETELLLLQFKEEILQAKNNYEKMILPYINNIINDNGVDNKEDNGGEKNGLDSDEINELCNNLKSDIYLDDKIKQKNNSNNNKEPSKNVKNKKKNKKKK